ncbi:MAG: SDR family oxidoreductase [candidate division WOR-3 bacterium]|jgi:NAD(P)-dependent dehydrogenase (short-subunit alcohol dehydrogenase family)
MKIDLSDNVILVTGAAGGIGEPIVRSLAEYGATVAVHFNKKSVEAERLAAAVGNDSRSFHADLAEPENGVMLFQEVLSTYGRIHTLVNNSGVYLRSPNDMGIREWLTKWETTIAVNLTAAGVLCREAVNHFKKHNGGRIINIASRAAFRGDYEDYFAYAASKGGMVALSRTIARTCGKYNIKSFVVAPGFVRTPIVDEYIKKHGAESIMEELALGELTTPEDVAPTVVFLASGLMDHATGCAIDINAGSYVR